VADPVLGQLRQGISPEKIALTIVVGFALGVFPVLGTSTSLCALAGLLLGLNQPILQLVNYAVYPFQIALIFVFLRLGDRILGAKALPISIPQMMEKFRASPVHFFHEFAATIAHCILGWCVMAPLATATAYLLLRPALRAAIRSLRR